MVKYEVQLTYSVTVDIDSDSETLAYIHAQTKLADGFKSYAPVYYEVLPGEE